MPIAGLLAGHAPPQRQAPSEQLQVAPPKLQGPTPTQADPSAGRVAGQAQMNVPNPEPSLHAQDWPSISYRQACSRLTPLPFDKVNVLQLMRRLSAFVGCSGQVRGPHFQPSRLPPQKQTSSPYRHLNVVLPQAAPAVGCVSGQTPQPHVEQVTFP